MPRFKVRVTREIGTETCEIEVVAEDRSAAASRALELADSGETEPSDDAKFTQGWEPNEGNDKESAFLGDEDWEGHEGGDIEEVP